MRRLFPSTLVLCLLLVSMPVLAIDEYRLDDGVKEQGIGIQSGSPVSFSMAWLNHFTIQPGLETITAIRISFGGSLLSNNIADGSPITVYLWGDFNSDGDPSDAFVIDSISDVVAGSGLNTPTTYSFTTPVTLPAGTSVFAGAIVNYPNQVLVASIDIDGTDSIPPYPPANNSWIAGSSNGVAVAPASLATAQLPVARVSTALFGGTGDGTWIIRMNAVATSAGPVLVVTPFPLDFGTVTVGAVAGPGTLQLENTGGAVLDISQIDPVPVPFSDMGTGTCPAAPLLLAPGQSCTMELAFAPTVIGVYDYALKIFSNDPASPTAYRVRGESAMPGGIFSDGFE